MNKKEKHPIDDFFREGLQEHKIVPGKAVWDKVAAETSRDSGHKRGGWYMMRAAVVLLLVGMSTWFFYQNNPQGYLPDYQPRMSSGDTNVAANPEKKSSETTNDKESEEAAPVEKKVPVRKREVPLMKKSSPSKTIYVENEPLPVVDETEHLAEAADLELEAPELSPAEVGKRKEPTLKVKLKLNKGLSESAFYADNTEGEDQETKDLGFKERVYAYANNQFDNLVKGRPLELPKSEKKPQLEINLDKLLND